MSPPSEQLDGLLNFQGNHFDGPNRDGLRLVIQEACKQRPSWAFQLDIALSQRAQWDSDLWPFLLRGVQEAELNLDEWSIALKSVARHELHSRYAREIADLLYDLVLEHVSSCIPVLLAEAEKLQAIYGKCFRARKTKKSRQIGFPKR